MNYTHQKYFHGGKPYKLNDAGSGELDNMITKHRRKYGKIDHGQLHHTIKMTYDLDDKQAHHFMKRNELHNLKEENMSGEVETTEVPVNHTADMVDHLIDGNLDAMKTSFEAAMGDKVASVLADRRLELAATMFHPKAE